MNYSLSLIVKRVAALQRCYLVSPFHDGHYSKSIYLNSFMLLFKCNFIANVQQNTNYHFAASRARSDIIITAGGAGLKSLTARKSSKAATCDAECTPI